ncbi:MAG: aldehyde dehydrogenase family protein [Gaiella sp.]|nr:aldehyde dehydrogenase family protein [Gaiella sp.]
MGGGAGRRARRRREPRDERGDRARGAVGRRGRRAGGDRGAACVRGALGRGDPRERAAALRRLAAAVDARADVFAAAETANVGKPIRESASLDVPGSVACLEYYASWADKLYGETIPQSSMRVLNYTVLEPLGVVAAIVPWNGPLSIAVWKLAPALAAGNTVILKPAELTPLTALMLAEAAVEAELPDGALNVVTGSGGVVGDALVTHPGVDKIAFTGSTAVGRRIMSQAAPTLKRLTLECGGKSPNLVFADADLDAAVEATLFGIFVNQGEVCAAGSRLLVEESIRDELTERLVTRAAALRVGSPADWSTEVGALVSRPHLESVHGYVETGVAEGAELLVGGGPARVDGLDGSFYAPTVLGSVDNSMRVAQEEIFGPVLVTIGFADEDDAVRIANDTIYGLSANVHTESLRRAHRVAERLQCGSVFVNLPPVPFAEAPFGGYKMTGIGKDLGRDALDGVTNKKNVVVDLAGDGERFRWYGEVAD